MCMMRGTKQEDEVSEEEVDRVLMLTVTRAHRVVVKVQGRSAFRLVG